MNNGKIEAIGTSEQLISRKVPICGRLKPNGIKTDQFKFAA